MSNQGKPRLFEADFSKPASMGDIHALAQIIDGYEKSVEKLQESAMTPQQIEQAVSDGMVKGMRSLIQDEMLMKSFWQRGYSELSDRATGDANMWIGKRVLTAISGVIVIAFLVWAVKSGHIR